MAICISNCSGSDDNPNPDPTSKETIQADASTVKISDQKQTIRGFGAATVFDPPGVSDLSSSDLDKEFGNNVGQLDGPF